jgi:hypothetical protein
VALAELIGRSDWGRFDGPHKQHRDKTEDAQLQGLYECLVRAAAAAADEDRGRPFDFADPQIPGFEHLGGLRPRINI